jgi:RNA polymerase sigma-70 factor (ECF subfamily)
MVPNTPLDLPTLIGGHWERLHRLFIALGDAPNDADDLVQDTITLILDKASRGGSSGYRPELGAFWSWLSRVALRHRVSVWRRNKKYRRGGFGEETEGGSPAGVIDAAPEPLPVLMRKEDHERLRGFIEMLPPVARQAVILYYFEDLSVKEIAELLGVPEGTIYRRLCDARIRLEKMLTEPTPVN